MKMIWKHEVTAGHISPLEPNHMVFGSEEDGYFIITPYSRGSHWKMPVADAFAMIFGKLVPIITENATALNNNPSMWRHARDIWPARYVQVEMLSPCCSAKIDASLVDGVMIGSCSKCSTYVVRMNPRTGVQEWLDGKSPWTEEDLTPVAVVV